MLYNTYLFVTLTTTDDLALCELTTAFHKQSGYLE